MYQVIWVQSGVVASGTAPRYAQQIEPTV